MAARTATKSGNWSDVTVWNGGVTTPTIGDTISTGAFIVTLDVGMVTFLTLAQIADAVRAEMDADSTLVDGIDAKLDDVLDDIHDLSIGGIDTPQLTIAVKDAIAQPF